MPQNKLVKLVLIALLAINVTLVLVFPVKAPKISRFELPVSAVDSQISVIFSELMDKQAVASAFQIYPAVKGKVSWAGKKFVFTPDQNLEFGKKYVVKFSGAARSVRGQGMGKLWLREFETMPLSFIFVNVEGGLERYFITDGGRKKLTSDGLQIKQYDYDVGSQRVVFVTVDNKIYLVDVDGENLGELNMAGMSAGNIGKAKWLPYENALLITNTREGQATLWRHDMKKNSTKMIKQADTLSYDFFPSPDGRQILYINENGALALYDLATGEENLVVRDFFEHFGFSEYGGYILYTIMTNTGVFDFSNNLVLHKNNGEKEILFKGENVRIKQPVISPNEDFMAFEYTVDNANNYEERVTRLGVLDLVTQKLTLVSPDSYQIRSPAVSPEGGVVFNKFSDDGGFPGWDLEKKKMVVSPLRFIQVSGDEEEWAIVDLGVEGAEVKWVY